MAVDELTGRTAVVTGGGRGLGLAMSTALVGAGANVVLTGTNAARGEAAAAELGERAVFVRQDVAQAADWPAVMATVRERFGDLDIMVANAGINTPVRPMAEMSLAEFRQQNEINLKGAYLALQHAVEAMRAHGRGGSVILISSVMGRISAPMYTHYSGNKAGVRLLAKAAALELGPEQIRVNAVLPGITRSDMTADFDEAAMAPVLIPLKRFGEAGEVADTVLFCASDRSKFMTGAELVIDGGLLTR